jgi:hypothetical protein
MSPGGGGMVFFLTDNNTTPSKKNKLLVGLGCWLGYGNKSIKAAPLARWRT